MKTPRLIMGRNGRWLLTFAEKLPDNRGWATRTVSTHTSVRAEAEGFRRRWISGNAVLDSGQRDKDDYLLADLIDGYLADLEQRGAGRSEHKALPNIAKGELGALYPAQLTQDVILTWGRRRKVSNGSLRRDLSSIRAMLNWGVRTGKLKAENVPHITLPPAGPARDVWLDEVSEQRLWDIAANDVETGIGRGSGRATGTLTLGGMFICLALGTGARREAIGDLTWDRVDLARRQIDFRKPERRVTKKQRVVVPINDRLLVVLTRFKDEWETVRHGIDPRVIPCEEDYPRRRVTKILRENGFSHITPHVFRHTFITLNLRAGVSIWDVSKLAGVSPVVLDKHYAHHVPDSRMLAQANRRFAA